MIVLHTLASTRRDHGGPSRSVPALCDALQEAGFAESVVYWEGTDSETGEGNDIFSPREQAPDDPAWICYIAGYRRT